MNKKNKTNNSETRRASKQKRSKGRNNANRRAIQAALNNED